MKMMEKILEIKVLNVKQLQHDCMVGYFKMDLGMIYSQPNHCYVLKWLVLVDTRHGGSYTKVHSSHCKNHKTIRCLLYKSTLTADTQNGLLKATYYLTT